MNLHDYQWSGNPRGLVARGPFISIDRDFVSSLKPGWIKIRAGTDEYVDDVEWLINSGITPFIQIIRDQHVGERCSDEIWHYTQLYLNKGVKFFELFTEPNLSENWLNSYGLSRYPYEDGEGLRAFCEGWLEWAERVINAGGYPAFPAMNEVDGEAASAFTLMAASINYFKQSSEEQFRAIGEGGLFLAVNPQVKNLFYQEVPGAPATPRPPAAMTCKEGGWHFEFPEDPLITGISDIDQEETLPAALQSGLLSSSRVFQYLIKKTFGLPPVPVFAVGGGIPLVEPPATFLQNDRLYPAITADSYLQSQMALWDWIAEGSPDWLLGSAFIHARKLAVAQPEYLALLTQMMKETPPLLKTFKGEKVKLSERNPDLNLGLNEVITGGDLFTTDEKDSSSILNSTSKKEVTPHLALGSADISGIWISLETQKEKEPIHTDPASVYARLDTSEKQVNWIFLTPSVDRDIFLKAARPIWARLSPVIIPDLDLLIYPPDDMIVRLILIASDKSESESYLHRALSLRNDTLCDEILCRDLESFVTALDDLR